MRTIAVISFRAVCLAASMVLLCCLSAQAQDDIHTVTATGPSWDNFTNEDGTGLYHEILDKVFGLYGIKVERLYAPSNRAKELVAAGRADLMTCSELPVPGTVVASHPMYEGFYHAFFNKVRIGPWRGMESLRDKIVTARVSYYRTENFQVPVQLKEVQTGVAGLGMVVLGRADFYVDDLNLIKESLAANTVDYQPEDYDIRPVGSRSYYPLFNTTDRGKRIMELFDRGMETMIRSGELARIFKKWNFTIPVYTLP
ncbi:MAG: transporter substrate-binding domain-containing protein [Proteobacteria bacterium]|nr:transporter substrate-binding domain-containing protein [Pseudomonadota bacterium]MBU1611605.1 transporter substrate-binding domain-containing protein [Pseudomonadota bacterium]